MQTLFPDQRSQQIYYEERLRYEAQEDLKRKKRTKRVKGCVITFLISWASFLGICFYFYYEAESNLIPVGAEVKLAAKDYGIVGIALDRDTYHKYQMARIKKDHNMVKALILTERLVFVDNWTKARIVTSDTSYYEVTPLEGKYGFIDKKDIHPVEPENKK